MPRTYLQWLLSPTGCIVVGLAWPFGVAATLLLANFVHLPLNDVPLSLWVIQALWGVPITILGLRRTRWYARQEVDGQALAIFLGVFLSLGAFAAAYGLTGYLICLMK